MGAKYIVDGAKVRIQLEPGRFDSLMLNLVDDFIVGGGCEYDGGILEIYVFKKCSQHETVANSEIVNKIKGYNAVISVDVIDE